MIESHVSTKFFCSLFKIQQNIITILHKKVFSYLSADMRYMKINTFALKLFGIISCAHHTLTQRKDFFCDFLR